jgi:hypothetical protein
MRKGNLIYICLINNRTDIDFIDEEYQKQQLNALYGNGAKASTFSGITQH